jgi:hypothetical protein
MSMLNQSLDCQEVVWQTTSLQIESRISEKKHNIPAKTTNQGTSSLQISCLRCYGKAPKRVLSQVTEFYKMGHASSRRISKTNRSKNFWSRNYSRFVEKSLKFLTSKCFKISLETILLDRFKAGPEISHCDKTNNCKENVRWQQPVLNKSQHALLFVKFKRTNLGKGAAFFEWWN